MNILSLIQSRRSIRQYQQKPVPKELLEQVVTAGIWAPSAMNEQPWRFAVVTNPAVRQTLTAEAKTELKKFLQTEEAQKQYGDAVSRFMARAESAEDTIFYGAPVVIFVIQTKAGADHFDCGLAAENMLLCAHGLGLGTVPVGLATPMNNSKIVRDKLNLKTDEKIVIAIALGYPDEAPEVHERKGEGVRWIE